MPEIVRLDPTAETRRLTSEVLRELLVRAEAGEFRSVHVCAFRGEDGKMERHSAGGYSVFDVVAALAVAQHSIIASNVERDDG